MSWTTGSRLRLLAGAVIALTFVAGGLSGAAMFRALHHTPEPTTRTQNERRPPDCPRTAEEQRLRDLRPYNNLGLTEEQTDQLLAILERRRVEIEEASRRARLPVDSMIDATRREIRSILTPEQVAEMDRRRARWIARDSARREENRRRCAELQNGGTPEQAASPDRENR